MKKERNELRKQYYYVLDNMIQDTLANIDDIQEVGDYEVLTFMLDDLRAFRILKDTLNKLDDIQLDYMFNQVAKGI
jgi:hypothetical protein